MPADHPTLITHTSGTTGMPKLAVHTGAACRPATGRRRRSSRRCMRRRETVAIHVSFVHSRLFTALAISLLRGFPMVVLATPNRRTSPSCSPGCAPASWRPTRTRT